MDAVALKRSCGDWLPAAPDVHAELGHRLQEQQAVLGLGAEALEQLVDAAGAVGALADVAGFGSCLRSCGSIPRHASGCHSGFGEKFSL